MFLSQVVGEQRLPIMKLKLKVLSGDKIESDEHVRGSLKELFEYSNEVDYMLFLTEKAPSQHSPPSTAASPCFLAELEPASNKSKALLDTQILDPPDQSIAYDAEHLKDRKVVDDLWGDYFS